MSKYWLSILLCIGLVFIQSQAELSLPDYMSDIVTNGIQSGGFNGPIGKVLSEETFDHLMIFMNGDEQNIVKDAYLYKDNFGEKIKEQFPKANNGYQLKELSDKQEKELEDILLKPMLMVASID